MVFEVETLSLLGPSVYTVVSSSSEQILLFLLNYLPFSLFPSNSVHSMYQECLIIFPHLFCSRRSAWFIFPSGSLTYGWFYGVGAISPMPSDLSGKGDPISSCATRGIALGIIWPLKPHHCIKIGIPSLRVLCLCVQVIWKSEVLQLWSFSKKRKLFFTSVRNLAICFSELQNCCLSSSENGIPVVFLL